MSIQNELFKTMLHLSKWQMEFSNAEIALLWTRLHLQWIALWQSRPPHVHTHSEMLNDVHCEWIWTDGADTEGAIIFLHGGGFMAGSPQSHRAMAWRLSIYSGRRVLAVDYPLAPEAVFPAQLESVLAVYKALLERNVVPTQIAFADDSAGGNLVLATALVARDKHLPLPGALLCYSPWTDLTHSGGSIHSNAHSERVIPVRLLAPFAQKYFDSADANHPYVSPLFGHYVGFPPTQLHAIEQEALRDDTVRLATRLRAAGVEIDCRLWNDLPHGFMLFADWLPEGDAALRCGGDFLKQALAVKAEVPPLKNSVS